MQSIIFMEEIPNFSAGLMPVKTFDGIEFIDFTNIIRFQADSKHTLIYIKDQPEPLNCILALTAIEERVPTSFFFRCHRSHIISLRYLKKFDKCKRIIHLIGNHSVIISEDRISVFFERIDPAYKKNK
jgi:DNA-binding LytR/AlgR family response regulator